MTSRLAMPGIEGGSPSSNSRSLSDSEEARRKRVVRLIFWVYALLLFEGVLRKWVFPQWGQILFFVRDPLVFSIYVFALSGKIRFGKSLPLFFGFVFGAACFVVLLIRLVSGSPVPAFLAIYGWRNYFFYVPLAFVAQRYLVQKDLEALVKGTLLLAIPMAVLVAAQTSSPAVSVINSGSGEDPEQTYGNASGLLEGGIVRPAGTFTSNLGLTAFIASSVALSIAMWLVPWSTRVISMPLLTLSTVATIVCLALSGSRGAMLWSGAVVVITILGLLCTNRSLGLKTIVLSSLLLLFGYVSMPFIFPRETKAFITRWTDANESERSAYGKGGIFARAIHEFGSFTLLINGTPPFGYGLGSAGNAAWRLGARDQLIPFANEDEVGAAETDWGRNILELGPIVGSLYITYRIVLALFVFSFVLAAVKRSGNPLSLLLFAFIALLLIYGEITANGTMNGYIWLFCGFCLAAATSSGSRSYPKHKLSPAYL